MTLAIAAANPATALAVMEVPALDMTAEAGQGQEMDIDNGTENTQESSENQQSPVVEAGNQESSETSSLAESTEAETSAGSPVLTVGSGSTGSGSSPVIGPGTTAGPGAGPGVPSENVPEQPMTDPTGNSMTLERIDYFSEPVADPTVIPVEKYSYETMVSDLEKLQARYGSERLQINVIGTSLDGRNLYEAVLGNPNAGKHILIHAGIHAREYMTPLLVMKQLEYGLEFYDRGSYAGQPLSVILQQVAVHFL